MEAIWNYLDGKKTAIGAGIGTLMGLLSALGLIWGFDHYTWFPKVLESGDVLAGLFGGTGLLHKAVKALPPTP